jgi:hypothetical protein
LIDKSKWRVVLVFLLAASLLLGTSLAVLAEDAPDKPTDCPVDRYVALAADHPEYFPGGNTMQDPVPGNLPAPEDQTLKSFKINMDQNQLESGYYIDPETGFKVYIWNDGSSFTWLSANYPVYHAYAKGGNQGGNLYMYYADPFGNILNENGVFFDCGLQQPGGGWSHITFYFVEVEYGCMEIVKLFEDYPEGWDLPESITVMIYGDEEGLSYPVAGEAVTIYEDDGEYVWNRCDLIPGDYTVSKTALEGWSLSMVPADGKVTVVAGDDPADLALVTITNTFEYGCMEIVKLFEDYPEGWDLPESITVMIYGDEEGLSYPVAGEAVTIYEDDGEYVWNRCDLIPGDYTVSKTALEGWSLSMNPADGKVTVVAGDDPADLALVTITNTFEYGCMEIVKLFEDYPEGWDLPASITVMIYGDEEGLSYPVAGEAVTIYEDDGEYVWNRCDLIPGDYTVSKTALEGWSLSMYPADGKVTVVAGDDPADLALVTITNTFEYGCMEIVKLFEDYPEGWDLPESITVMIYGDEEGLSYPVAGEAVTIYEDDGEYVWNRCDLIPGDYTVSKTALEGWSLVDESCRRQGDGSSGRRSCRFSPGYHHQHLRIRLHGDSQAL